MLPSISLLYHGAVSKTPRSKKYSFHPKQVLNSINVPGGNHTEVLQMLPTIKIILQRIISVV